jgi:hypothetical protein
MKKNLNINKMEMEGGAGSQSNISSPERTSTSLSSKSLYELMMEKLLIEDSIIDAGGEITDDLDIIWQQKDLEVKEKLDAYGHLFTELDAEKKKLQAIKASGVDKVRAAEARVQNLEKRLKSRLNMLSNGESLRGHIYSFHPFESKVRTVDVEKLSPPETYLTIEIRQDYWEHIQSLIERFGYDPEFSIKKKIGKVSELSDEHPAVMTVLTPSVRIT